MKKTSLLHSICRMATVAAMALLAACSSDNDPVAFDDSTDTTPTETAATRRMLFTMNPTATRSLTYDGVTTTMTDGTLIGCVITSGATSSAATYYATAAWEYDEDSATLTISRWWTYDTTAGTWTLHEATSSSTTDALSYDSSGYTLINTEDYLYFYFYYPYIDPVNFEGSDDESSIASYVPRVSSSTTNNDNSGTTTYTYLMGMPVGESIASSVSSISSYETTTTTTTVNLTTALPVFSWKEFPVFVNQDQSTQDAINMSDFLYDACEVGVNDESVGEVTISLRKKTTAIRVKSSDSLNNVKLINGSGDAITLGRYVDLYDGNETAMGSSDTYYSSSYLDNDGSISAYTISDGLYRFILPAQSNWCGKLSYSRDDDSDDDDTSTTYSLSLADFGDGQLVNGTLYTVSVLPKEDIYCYWSGTASVNPSDGSVTTKLVTNVSGVYSYGSKHSTDAAAVQTMGTSITLDGTTYSYALKFDSKPYLQIVVPVSDMTLTLYYNTNNTTSSFSLKYYTYDTSTSTAGTETTLDLESVGTSTYSSVSISSLSKGTYRIVQGSNQSFVFYVLLSYPK